MAARTKQSADPVVRWNIVAHPTEILVKRIEHVPSKPLIKLPGGRIPRGCKVSTKETPLSQYVKASFGGGVRQYNLPANADLGIGTPIGARDFVPDDGVDRTAGTMVYLNAPATLTFDHDLSPYAKSTFEGPGALHDFLVEHFPEVFGSAAWGAYDSSSSYIYDESGTEILGRRGFHLVFAVADATTIPAVANLLFKWLWILGFGYIHISKSGAALPRTAFDKKVTEPQQPLFAGGADCTNCEQRRPEPEFHDGDYLNVAALADLTAAQLTTYSIGIADAKSRVHGECERIKRVYQKKCVDELVQKTGMSIEQARRIVESRLGGVLVGSDILRFDEFGDVTVAEVLANPDKYDESTLADPVDGDVAGKAILYINAASGGPIVYSHAHGGGTFLLKHDLPSLLKWLDRLTADQASQLWPTVWPIIELRADEMEQYLAAVKDKVKIGIGALRKTVNDMQRQAARSASQGLEQDPGLYVAQLLLQRSYNGGTTLIKLESGYFWKYTGTHWMHVKDSVLTRELHELAIEQWDHVLKMWDYTEKKPSTLSSLVASALSCLGSKVVVEGDPLRLNATRPSVINCTNGELWLTDDGPQLRQHRPDSYLTSCSPIQYDPDAIAPTFEIAMRGILSLAGGEPMPDQDDMLRHVEELLGYSIQTRRNLKVFVLIVGPGDNGKSRIIKLFTIVLGNDAIAFDRLAGVDEDGNRFATVRLVGKQVLIDDDVDYEYLLPDGLLKKIAEEKPLTAEGKFKDSFTFTAQVVPWLLGNSWPRSRDLSRGMQTRANVLYLPRAFLRPAECEADHPDRQRPELWDKIYTEEMPGVLNRLIAGYERVAKRGGFLPPLSAQRAFDMWLAEANVVSRFIEEACERIDPDKPDCLTSMAHDAFKFWADSTGVQERHRPQQNQIKKRFEELGFRVAHTEHGTAVFGIRIKPEWSQLCGTGPFKEKPPKARTAKTKSVKAKVPGIDGNRVPVKRGRRRR